MRVAVYGRKGLIRALPPLQQLFDLLVQKDIGVIIHEELYKSVGKKIRSSSPLNTFKDYDDIRKGIDYVITVGGDGTILDTITLVRDSNIPVLGINTGRLGFLATTGQEDIEKAINALEKGSFKLDKRSLLQLESNKDLFGATRYALNDFTIHKKDTSSMITIHTYIDGDYLNAYWADGLVVATATGSTAYALSCGGPIIFPTSESLVIAPVAPHNMNVRPVVVPDISVISFKIESDRSRKFLCTLDSRFKTIDASYQLSVRKANFNINLVKLHNDDFATTLRSKLMWGLDKRN